jgi:hypothetical protein
MGNAIILTGDNISKLKNKRCKSENSSILRMESVIQTVNEEGFYCSTIFKEDIPGLERIILPLFINVTFEGSFETKPFSPKKGEYIITGLQEPSDYRNDWVRILGFNTIPMTVTGNEPCDEWEYLDYETLYTKMRFDVHVYFHKIQIKNGKYYIINTDGHVIKVKTSEIAGIHNYRTSSYIDGLYCTLNELIHQNNIIVIPRN